jgi:hypothetical protein
MFLPGSDVIGFTTGGSEAMRITSTGSVGIGASSPVAPIHVNGENSLGLTAWFGNENSYVNNAAYHYADARVGISGRDSDGTDRGAGIEYTVRNTGNSNFSHGYTVFNRDGAYVFGLGGSGTAPAVERLRITSAGNVGIGTSSPATKLHIESATTNEAIRINSSTGFNAGINYYVNNVIKWTAQALGDGSDAYRFYNFVTNSEAMRIDASGNLLVGKTNTSDLSGDAGAVLAASGYGYFTRDGAIPLHVSRLTDDGDLLQFRRGATAVGSIGVESSNNMYFECSASNHPGLLFFNEIIIPRYNQTNSDGDVDLGRSVNRFNDIYATNGTIQTSDRNEKQDIAELDEAERRVAVACKGLLRKFRWKSAVEEKGDNARIHFGIIAQDLQAAFEAEGLDAGRYAMFIHSTWTDEETGEEKSRMGVRYPQLLAFIIAAI